MVAVPWKGGPQINEEDELAVTVGSGLTPIDWFIMFVQPLTEFVPVTI
jgi:hypothetical protein